ncbi:MAG: hypothetical protein AB8C84_13210 [Oligoflexales bacterium]
MKTFILFIICVFPTSLLSKDKEKIQISRHWQKTCVALIENSPEKHGWGLFSYSGWVDIGQWCLIGDNLHWVEGGAKNDTPMEKNILNSEQLDYFLKKTKHWIKAKDFPSHTFDGLQFEFVHWVKGEKSIKTQKRIFMNNPKEAPWTEIIETFQKFTASFKKKKPNTSP